MNQTNDSSFQDLWSELSWRGLIADSTNDLEVRRLLNKQSITFYCGFDPTAPSLHLGNLLQLLVMRRLQLAGHNPLLLIGGSTGLIGDPRPSSERTLNTRETVASWVEKLRTQAGRFLKDDEREAKVVNNLDWFQEMSALDFLRDFGKFFRVNQMVKKDAVRARLESDNGISFTEFSYQILQASDFLELFRSHGCVLQTGGSDQWGNMIGGTDLVKSSEGETVHAMTTPLIMNSDGTKFGKSEGNAIWLDEELTSPFAFHQFWLNTADADVIQRLKMFTFLSRERIKELVAEVENNPGARAAQRVLADEVTALVHGQEKVDQVKEVASVLFTSAPLETVSVGTWGEVFREISSITWEQGETVAQAAVRSGLCSSISDVRRTVKQNGLSINNTKVTDADAPLAEGDLFTGEFLILRKGKKQLAGLRNPR